MKLDEGESVGLCAEGEENFGRIRSLLYSILSPRLLGRFHDFVANDVLSLNPDSVLDIGSGVGDVLVKIVAKRDDIELYGTDPSPHMLKIAEKRIRNSASEKGLDKIHLALGSSRVIPFDRKFDVIFSSLSFHHWKEREAGIPYVMRKLNNGGNFVIYEFNREALSLLRRKLCASHSLSADDLSDINFEGTEKKIAFHMQFIKVEFTQLEGKCDRRDDK